MSEDLDEIRKQRMRELEGQAQSSQDVNKIQKEQEAREAYESQKQSILRQILTESAKQRLSNVKLVKSQLAEAIEDQLIQLYQTRKLGPQVTEDQLLQMLKQLQGSKRESKIKFKRV